MWSSYYTGIYAYIMPNDLFDVIIDIIGHITKSTCIGPYAYQVLLEIETIILLIQRFHDFNGSKGIGNDYVSINRATSVTKKSFPCSTFIIPLYLLTKYSMFFKPNPWFSLSSFVVS